MKKYKCKSAPKQNTLNSFSHIMPHYETCSVLTEPLDGAQVFHGTKMTFDCNNIAKVHWVNDW